MSGPPGQEEEVGAGVGFDDDGGLDVDVSVETGAGVPVPLLVSPPFPDAAAAGFASVWGLPSLPGLPSESAPEGGFIFSE
jgi:hypothetical protein